MSGDVSGAAQVRVKLVLGEFYRRWLRGPIFLGGMHDLRPAPSPENGFAGFGLLASVLQTASSLFLLAKLLHAVVAIVDVFICARVSSLTTSIAATLN